MSLDERPMWNNMDRVRILSRARLGYTPSTSKNRSIGVGAYGGKGGCSLEMYFRDLTPRNQCIFKNVKKMKINGFRISWKMA